MKKLDILFVHANASKKIYQGLSDEHSAIEPPIWAAMLANHARSRGFSAKILDCEAERISYDDAALEIKYANPRVVCFVVYGQQPSAGTQNMTGATATSKVLKEVWPESLVLFVGPHVSALPAKTLNRESSIDMVCQNEGVYTISNLLASDFKTHNLKKINGLVFRDGEEVIINPPERIVKKADLQEDLPGMAWDLLPDIKKYRTAGWHSWSNDSEKSPFGSIYTSLGCPFKCSFCMINIINRTDPSPGISAADSNLWRWWKPEFIIKQFDQMAQLGIKNVKIADELFVLNPRHFVKICELLIERDYGFNIWAYSRIDTCKPKYLDTLKKAGVNWLGLGIENPNQTLRQEIHKDSYQEVRIYDIMNHMRDAGINIGANYIFGLPQDTKESMQETLNFALENKTEMTNMYSAMAYPGSPLHNIARQKGVALPSSYEGYSQHSYETLNLANDNLSASEILAFRDYAWDRYHTDEGYLELLENKFGKKARTNVENTTKIKLKRKLLGD
jgi:anaerobic magnesium-protoporphyrin IX monomethyl ester cyclase